jgi:FkbM family methyltransferase
MKRVHILLAILIISVGLLIFYRTEASSIATDAPSSSRPNWLVEKYGSKHFSQHDEELIIRDYFADKKRGFFVDIGANHYRSNSTTFYLEKFLGWSGIAVDAICSYGKAYEIYRPNTRFFCFYISDTSDAKIDFFVNLQNKRVSTGVERLAKRQGAFDKAQVVTITLNDLLERVNVKGFDFLSMDIELAEPSALAGFNIQKYAPSFVCIEAHDEVKDQILEYFSENGYRLLKRYVDLDPLNYYFAPNSFPQCD